MTHSNNVAHSVPAANTPAFDLSNPQHLAMRKLMADIHIHHVQALAENLLTTAAKYRGMVIGLKKVALYVLHDESLFWLCFELESALEAFEELNQIQARAAA
ncbi:conserved hypothetical protein [Shewanella halifaxensis HAW-EB4]|uniref:Uncharacterized protein n=1 Tax=Shewanella halifaxensis (strain HAW-EB4) TaxID=458817 RepID=B0TKS7_SHEHH|nr:hypothetical protein [Shewanella halifaxensis]ABZ75879.1 conserved hypothetical protein [Shewanella halifaxensis HAW-EB4]